MSTVLIFVILTSLRVHVGVNYGFIPSSESMRGGSETSLSLTYPIGKSWFGGGSVHFSKYISLGEGDYRVNFLGGGLHLEGQPLSQFWKSLWISMDLTLSRMERARDTGKEKAAVPLLRINPYLYVFSLPGASFTFEASGTLSSGKKYLWSTLGFGVGVVFQWPIGRG